MRLPVAVWTVCRTGNSLVFRAALAALASRLTTREWPSTTVWVRVLGMQLSLCTVPLIPLCAPRETGWPLSTIHDMASRVMLVRVVMLPDDIAWSEGYGW